MNELLHCKKCKRPILKHEQNLAAGIVYCYGCNYYFPHLISTDRKREEISIPNRTSYIRLRLMEDSLEIVIKWFGNYSLRYILKEILSEKITAPVSFLGYLFNKTIIKVDKKVLRIDHLPIDLLPMTYYQSAYVKQLYIKPVDSTAQTYGLYTLLTTGEEQKLIWNLNKRTLLFIEQEIERVIGIEDVAVEGEIQ
ncbi:MAG: hypothetical protein AB8G15_16260 [Saprospiraceae bacterium]